MFECVDGCDVVDELFYFCGIDCVVGLVVVLYVI